MTRIFSYLKILFIHFCEQKGHIKVSDWLLKISSQSEWLVQNSINFQPIRVVGTKWRKFILKICGIRNWTKSGLFQTNNSIFYNKSMWKNVWYMAPGFEPTTFGTITTRPGLPPNAHLWSSFNFNFQETGSHLMQTLYRVCNCYRWHHTFALV